jgi:cytosine/adenosine deaminase-related metal-dependent hydrolase
MRQLAEMEPSLRAEDILKMATVNAAASLGESGRLGRLRAGFLADLVTVPFVGSVAGIADEIISFPGQVPWLMVDGEVVRG